MQWKGNMHSRIRLLLPLGLLFFGCIDVPPVEQPPVENPPPDAGVQGDFSLTVSPTRASLFQGKSQTLQLSLTRQGDFSGSVSVSAVNAPAGISVLPTTIPAGSTSVNLDVSVAESATPGTQVLTLRATSGALSHDTAFELTVVKLGDLLVSWASPSPDKLYVNGALPLEVTVEGGTADYVEVLKGQTVLKRLSASPYQFAWDTTQETDGDYVITARAVRASGTFTSTTKSVTVDHTAPTLVSRSPAADASNVSVREVLQANFSEALNPSTVKDSSVLVTVGGASIAKMLSLSADGKSLTVTPASPLPVQSTVAITLGTGTAPLMDLAGNALAAASWTFSVPAWLPMGSAISALAGSTSAENVAMRMDRNGDPVIAWSEFDGSAKNVYVRRWNGTRRDWDDIGGALSDIAGAGTDADRPALWVDGANQPVVVWDEKNSNKINLSVRKWSGASWDALPSFPDVSASDNQRTAPSIVMDGNGKMTVAASYYNGTSNEMDGFALAPGQSAWTKVLSKPSNIGQPTGPQLSIDASGVPVLAFTGFSDAGWGVLVSRYSAGSSWSSVGTLIPNPSGRSVWHSSITLDGTGTPVVVWDDASTQDGALVEGNIYAARWNGSSWVMLGGAIGGGTLNADSFILTGGDGQPLVARSGVSASERSILVSHWDGTAWQAVGTPLSAVSGSSTAAFRPVMALDKNGQPLVAWHESDGNVSNVYVYRYNY